MKDPILPHRVNGILRQVLSVCGLTLATYTTISAKHWTTGVLYAANARIWFLVLILEFRIWRRERRKPLHAGAATDG